MDNSHCVLRVVVWRGVSAVWLRGGVSVAWRGVSAARVLGVWWYGVYFTLFKNSSLKKVRFPNS
jgi:hypothetical protein